MERRNSLMTWLVGALFGVSGSGLASGLITPASIQWAQQNCPSCGAAGGGFEQNTLYQMMNTPGTGNAQIFAMNTNVAGIFQALEFPNYNGYGQMGSSSSLTQQPRSRVSAGALRGWANLNSKFVDQPLIGAPPSSFSLSGIDPALQLSLEQDRGEWESPVMNGLTFPPQSVPGMQQLQQPMMRPQQTLFGMGNTLSL